MTRRTPIHVVMVSPLPPPYGGIAHWTQSMQEVCAGHSDVKLTILDTAPKRRKAINASFASRIAEGMPRITSDVWRLAVMLRRSRPDVVHINTSGSLALLRDIAIANLLRYMRIPVVLHFRFGRIPEVRHQGGLEWLLVRLAVKSASLAIVLDEGTLQAISPLGVPTISVPNFIQAPDASLLNQPRGQNLLFIGWVVETKGVFDLIAAWESMASTGWTLDIVGPLGSGREIADLATAPPPGVSFIGEVTHTESLHRMATCGLFILPSHTEGFPNVIAEAMSVGAPILASDVGAIPEMLADGAGVVVPSRARADLASEMALLISDSNRRRDMGMKAREKSWSQYGCDNVLSTYVELWNQLAEAGIEARFGRRGLVE